MFATRRFLYLVLFLGSLAFGYWIGQRVFSISVNSTLTASNTIEHSLGQFSNYNRLHAQQLILLQDLTKASPAEPYFTEQKQQALQSAIENTDQVMALLSSSSAEVRTAQIGVWTQHHHHLQNIQAVDAELIKVWSFPIHQYLDQSVEEEYLTQLSNFENGLTEIEQKLGTLVNESDVASESHLLLQQYIQRLESEQQKVSLTGERSTDQIISAYKELQSDLQLIQTTLLASDQEMLSALQ